ncbi:TPA: hypothetical protein EYP12_02830 [Candidatus Bipolaricaulota bacterium]|nr:hypothetical protein [Candidatus Bipolaricaulota bacterium]
MTGRWRTLTIGCGRRGPRWSPADQRKVTGFFSIKDDLIHAGAEWVDQEVVHDGNLITSRFPDDLPAFCRTIIEALGG